MGGSSSKQEEKIDNSGTVNNVVVEKNPVTIESKEIDLLLAVLVEIQLILLCMNIYENYTKLLFKTKSHNFQH